MNWACYFATGDTRYLDNVVAMLAHLDEREDLDLYLAAATAKWSLSSIARSDTRVRTAVEAIRAGGRPS